MEREVSAANMIGVAMYMLAAFISIVMVTVRIGDSMKASAYNNAAEIQANSESGTLKDLRGTDKEMSVAAIFGIIQNGDDYIGNIDVSRIDGTGLGTTKEASMKYIQNNLSGRARLAVEYDAYYGWYNLELHKTTCTDVYSSHSTCN